ncbi:MAG: hypothetical protein FD149_1080 [Rhodospirillaceae bacterium]|nr:MAG: hypothetical protein FD149_1080 [Rhodospirillaceae bacterium]
MPMLSPSAFLQALSGRRLALVGLALGVVALFAVNLAAVSVLKPLRLDLTEEGLFTLSEGTRRVLVAIDEPVTVRLYFSRRLGEASPPHAMFHNRVKGLLLQYADLAHGGLKVELIDPEPFSEAEDRAVAFGLQGVPITTGGDVGYFGLAATNSVDAKEVVPFFALERETFLEYDLTRMLHSLALTKRKTIGLLSTLPIDGLSGQSGLEMAMAWQRGARPWLVMEQIRELFEIRSLPATLDVLPRDVDVLMLVQPKGLPEKTLQAIDRFVRDGGRVLVFVDPVAESGRREGEKATFGAFDRLLRAWGVAFNPDTVAANADAARRVNAGQGARAVIADYVAWLTLGQETLDAGDAVVGGLERITMATAGILEPVTGGTTTFQPLITTSPRSMRLAAGQFASSLPDVVGFARGFRSENHPLVLAARLTGAMPAAFPEGPSDVKRQDSSPNTPQPANIIIVADTDVLADDFWVQRQNFFGQQIVVPLADNGTFVINALEDLSGAEALIGLRGRGRTDRPFTLVAALRHDAEMRYRAKEQELLQQIEAVQGRMRTLEQREGKPAEALLTSEERKTLEDFRRDLLTARRELRAVKHALAQDIERLEGWLKAINIAGVPVLLVGFAVGMAWRRQKKEKGGEA